MILEFQIDKRWSLFLLTPLICCILSTKGEAQQNHLLSYEHDGAIYISQQDGKGGRKIAKGDHPALSSDGKRLVFNTNDPSTSERQIVLLDLKSRQKKILSEIPSDNCFGPIWSPDGRMIAFQIIQKEKWEIAVIGSDGKEFHLVTKCNNKAGGMWLGAWAKDGNSLFCHDSNTIYLLSLNGSHFQKWEIDRIIPGVIAHGCLNSASGLSLAPDGKNLLLSVDMDEKLDRHDLDMAPAAIWSLNLENGRASRLSPKGVLEWAPNWISNDGFLCSQERKGNHGPSIYKVSADGSHRSLLVLSGMSPSGAQE